MEDMQKRELHIMPPTMMVKAATVALIALALWAVVGAFKSWREFSFVGAGVSATNTISISGEGEVFAVPDIATFSLSVQEEAKEVEDAQREATRKNNEIIDALKSMGVEEKDIKTQNYNVHPRYEWRETSSEGRIIRPGGERVLVGFEVSQTLQVKVRDTEKAGEILSEVGKLGVSNVSGLSFTIDDEDDLQREARDEAIEDAQEKARQLARDLGVDLVRIVGFSEGGRGYEPQVAFARSFGADAAIEESFIPEIPVGENKIVSNVTITYEIR